MQEREAICAQEEREDYKVYESIQMKKSVSGWIVLPIEGWIEKHDEDQAVSPGQETDRDSSAYYSRIRRFGSVMEAHVSFSSFSFSVEC